MKEAIQLLVSLAIIVGGLAIANNFLGEMQGNDIWWYFTGCTMIALLEIKRNMLENWL